MVDRLLSGNGRFALLMQDDGNLVLYHDGTPVWATNTVVEDPAPPDPQPPLPGAKLTLQGRFLYRGDQVFRWQGITAFALTQLVATGRESDALNWMAARQDLGFNLFRVLAMCSWLELSPAAGLAALPRLLTLAASRGACLEVVALSDTAAFNFTPNDCRDQVSAVARLATGHGHVVVQVANEHYHATHIPWLHDPANVDALMQQAPIGAIVTSSPSANDEALVPAGEYLTRHLDRGRDKWNMVRRVRELENVSAQTSRYVVNDEPIGAAEVEQPGRRLTDPAIFFTFGVLGRIFEVGSTFHCEAGLRCDPLGPTQQACAQAFLHGATLMPPGQVLTFKNAGWVDSPVRAYDTSAAVRVYTGIAGDEGWTCALGLTGDPKIQWQHGWTPGPIVAIYPGVVVMPIRRT